MEIIENLVDPSKYNIKCPYYMEPEFLVVHNTANDASAENEIAYMINNNNEVSYHYAVDDEKIVQGIPEDRNAWHAGDGNGIGNRKGIAIEICYSKSGGERFDNAERLAAKFIAYKLKERGWGMEQVKKHQDFSNKYCPHRTLDYGWERFLNMIEEELEEKSPIQYKAHLQDIGWTDWIKVGEVIGTTGESRRMEAIILEGLNGVELEYRTHLEDIGWTNWVKQGEVSGTEGESRRIEAIEIKSNVPLLVTEHVQDIGWLPASRGENVKIGTEGKALRLEAFKIDLM